MAEVRISRHDFENARWPREFHSFLASRAVQLHPFQDRGALQPISDYLEWDFHRDLVTPWRYFEDVSRNEFVFQQGAENG